MLANYITLLALPDSLEKAFITLFKHFFLSLEHSYKYLPCIPETDTSWCAQIQTCFSLLLPPEHHQRWRKGSRSVFWLNRAFFSDPYFEI